MSMLRIVIGTAIGVVLAVIVLYLGISYWLWWAYRVSKAPLPAPVSFQIKMLEQGYWHDRNTHCWYLPAKAHETNGCIAYGSPDDADFQCTTPLKASDGIPDQR